jgi:hypothetical protein
VYEAVQDSTSLMKSRKDHVKELSISRLITSIYGIGHKIRQLQHPGYLRVSKQRNFRKALHSSEASPGCSELGHESLDCFLVTRLIEDHQAPLFLR